MAKKRRKKPEEAKLNITSMMDMFTIMLFFLLKSFSSQGQLVTPAEGLNMPQSTVEKAAVQALGMEVSLPHVNSKTGKTEKGKVTIEGKPVVTIQEIKAKQGFLIEELQEVLERYSSEAEKMSRILGKEFKGDINIQADTGLEYSVLTKIMFTCGRSGFPNMNLMVYKTE